MKISFIRIQNSALPEPYKSLSPESSLYLTDNGYVYPEGASQPIDVFDPAALSKITESPFTTIYNKAKITVNLEADSETVLECISKNIDILSCIKQSRYASLKGLTEKTKQDKEVLKNRLDIMMHLGLIERYQSYFRIQADNKALIEYELSKV